MEKLVIGKRYRLLTLEEIKKHPKYEHSSINGCFINGNMKLLLGKEVVIDCPHRNSTYWIEGDKERWEWDINMFQETCSFNLEDIYNGY